jgi:hypothetical protein
MPGLPFNTPKISLNSAPFAVIIRVRFNRWAQSLPAGRNLF